MKQAQCNVDLQRIVEYTALFKISLEGSFYVEVIILGSEIIGNLNLEAKMFHFEECVLIGWLANTVKEPANQDVYP